MKQNGIHNFIAHYRQSDGASQTVRKHLEETSALASIFAGKVGLSSLGALTGLLHDLGKYSIAFQAYISPSCLSSDDERCASKQVMKGKIDHSSAGAQFSWKAFTNNQTPLLRLAGQMMALCIASHHSGLIDCLATDGDDIFSKRMMKTIEPMCREAEERYIQGCVADLLASSSIEDELRCWLETLKNSESSREIQAFMLGLSVKFLFSSLIDADRLNTADFENEAVAHARYLGEYPGWETLIEKLETHLTGLKTRRKVDKIRREVSSACLDFANCEKGLYQLTVPTGGGKTLASLRFAMHHAHDRKMDRIIYVAPYISIIDQNAGVARSILEKGNDSGKPIVLEHHSNLAPEQDTWMSRVLSEDWDAPIVFTTAVQLLETLFGGGTRGVRRMHQLANAVLILDEAQALPIKTVHLFNNAINFLVAQCGSTVVLCTATQPLLDKVDASKGAARLSSSAQMVPDVGDLFKALCRVAVLDKRKNGGWTEDEVARCARQEVERAGSALVIVNMKVQARELYRRCRERMEHVYHLSTSMCPAHRMDVLNNIKERLDRKDPKPVLCVSTQLIEAGVDVDFGSVIRYLAGLDSIAQAAGRCNRNGLRRSRGKVFIVNPADENLDKLPDIRRAQEITERILDEYRADPAAFDHDLQSPAAMSRYYQYYFFERAHEMAYPLSSREIDRNDTLFSLLSTNAQSVAAFQRVCRAEPPFIMCQSFAAAAEAFKAIDTPTQGVIVPYGEEGRRIIADLFSSIGLARKSELLKQAQRYSVNMFPYELQTLREKGGLHEVWEGSGVSSLNEQYYSHEFGASVEQVRGMQTLTE